MDKFLNMIRDNWIILGFISSVVAGGVNFYYDIKYLQKDFAELKIESEKIKEQALDMRVIRTELKNIADKITEMQQDLREMRRTEDKVRVEVVGGRKK
jgi:hypothetical protein